MEQNNKNPVIRHPFMGPIKALGFTNNNLNYIYVGIGSYLYIYDIRNSKIIDYKEVFQYEMIHGFDINNSMINNQFISLCAVYGQKELVIYKEKKENIKEGSFLEIFSSLSNVSDLILNVKILFKDSYIKNNIINLLICIGFGHNYIEIWNSTTKIKIISIYSQEKRILNCLSIYGESLNELKIASGSILHKIIIWKPFLNPINNGKQDYISYLNIKNTKNTKETTLQMLEYHDGSLFCIRWSLNGKYLASVSDDRTLQLHKLKDNKNINNTDNTNLFIQVFRSWGHTARIWDVKFIYNREKVTENNEKYENFWLTTTSEDGNCKIWDKNGHCLITLSGHIGSHIWCQAVRSYNINKESNKNVKKENENVYLITGGGDGSIKMWDIQKEMNKKNIHHIRVPFELLSEAREDGNKDVIRNLAISSDNKYIFVTTKNGIIVKHDIHDKTWQMLGDRNNEIIRFSMIYTHKNTKYITAGDLNGYLYVYNLSSNDLKMKWKAHNGRIMFLEEEIILKEDKIIIFSSSVDCTLHEWIIDISSKDDYTYECKRSFICPGKTCISSLCFINQKYFLSGDGRGNLFLYNRQIEEKRPILVEYHAHQSKQITCIIHNENENENENDNTIMTAGHDGMIKIHHLIINSQSKTDNVTLVLEKKHSIKGIIATIEKVWIVENENQFIHRKNIIIFGFYGSDAILYNYTNKTKLFTIPCGGWRRPNYINILNKNSGIIHQFIFEPCDVGHDSHSNTNLLICSDEELYNIENNTNHLIREAFRCKLTTCVFWDYYRTNFILTGSEDNSIKLHLYNKDNKNFKYYKYYKQPVLYDSCTMHHSAIRALSTCQISFNNNNETLLVTGGGKHTINIWKIRNKNNLIGSNLVHLLQYEKIKNVQQNQRILAVACIFISIQNEYNRNQSNHVIITGDSEGNITIFLIDIFTKSCIELTCFFYTNKPILCLQYLLVSDTIHPNNHLIITGSTNGMIAIWDISHLIHLIQIGSFNNKNEIFEEIQRKEPIHIYNGHKMGVNCLSVLQPNRNNSFFIVATAGDDQDITISSFNIQRNECMNHLNRILPQNELKRIENASGSAIKGIYIDENVIIAAGYDQRINIWQMDYNKQNNFNFINGKISECADITGISVKKTLNSNHILYEIIVVGEGMQKFDFYLEK